MMTGNRRGIRKAMNCKPIQPKRYATLSDAASEYGEWIKTCQWPTLPSLLYWWWASHGDNSESFHLFCLEKRAAFGEAEIREAESAAVSACERPSINLSQLGCMRLS